MALTGKQEIFCLEYCIDWNATRAAKVAGYSAKRAYAIGNHNLKKVEVQSRIAEIKGNLEAAAGVSALRNIKELSKLAFADFAGLAKEHPTDPKELWMELKDWDKLSSDQRAAIAQVKFTKFGIEIKLHDKMRAMEILNKMLGYNAPEKHDVEFVEQPLFTRRK